MLGGLGFAVQLSLGGLYPADARTKEGNLIAYNTALSVVHLVRELDAKGTWEQPAGSYMFQYLEQDGGLLMA